jgi:hypothetical protein
MSHFENKNRTNKFTGYRNIVAKKTRSKKHRRRKNQRGAGPETFSEEQKKNIQNEIKKMLEQDPGNITDIEKYIDELTDYDSETVNSTEKKQKLRNFFLEGTNISFDEMEKGMEKEQHMEKGMEKEQYMEKGMEKEQHMEKGMEKEQYMEKGMEKEQHMEKGMEKEYDMEKGMEKEQWKNGWKKSIIWKKGWKKSNGKRD